MFSDRPNIKAEEVELTVFALSLHEVFRHRVIPRYVEFRNSVDEPVRSHAQDLRSYLVKLADIGEARRLISLEPTNPEAEELAPLNRFLEELTAQLAKWRLVPSDGRGPLLGPFAAALALGLETPHKRWRENVPDRLVVMPGLGGGTFCQAGSYSQAWLRHGREQASEWATSLGLNILAPGHGRVPGHNKILEEPSGSLHGYQLHDAEWWTVRNVGKVDLSDISRAISKHYQHVQRAHRRMDWALASQDAAQ